ncbi:MAG: hypothetical protein ACLFSE_04635 [Spirochaetia bacterium]
MTGTFTGIGRCAADASSIIYMLKAGFLGFAGVEVDLFTVPEIFNEVGWPELPLTVVTLENAPEGESNDYLLLRLAEENSLAVLSEDKKLLLEAEKRGLKYYNSLMLLIFLRYRDRIIDDDYRELRERLLLTARYSRDVIEYADTIYTRLIPPVSG